jgi:hypothetical protein
MNRPWLLRLVDTGRVLLCGSRETVLARGDLHDFYSGNH